MVRFRRRLARWLSGHTVHFAVATVIIYAATIPLMIWVFPSTTLVLALLVAITGFTSNITNLATLLTTGDDV